MNYKEALTAAPPTPDCFPDREQWAAYLSAAQDEKTPSRQPFQNGIYKPKFNFCEDCTLLYSTAMARAGKCFPSKFRGPVIRVFPNEQAI